MKKKVLYVGLDVDDKKFHGTIFSPESGDIESFAVYPTINHLKSKLKEWTKRGYIIKCCYEASYIGFTLYRSLNKVVGIECEVIAPSLIPTIPGRQVKTDRIDSYNLAKFYSQNLLTPIYVPDEKDEEVRDLLRSRVFVKDQIKQIKRHILSVCRRYNLNYRTDTKSPRANHWTGQHIVWLKSKIKECNKKSLTINLSTLLETLLKLENSVELYDQEVEFFCQDERYKNKVNAIKCFRGIGDQSAITLVVEIGDIRRFSHPKELVSYAGLDVRERSSGGKEKKMGISRLGNKFIRTTLVECSQRSHLMPTISKPLKKRREECQQESIEIADRCMKRVHKKATRLLHRDKPINKIKVACAREMLGFIWESLSKVS